MNSDENMSIVEEVELEARPGLPVMVMVISLYLISILLIIAGGVMMEQRESYLSIIMIVTGIIYFCICWIPFMGLKILKPQEALVLTLFGKYIETLKGAGRGRFFGKSICCCCKSDDKSRYGYGYRRPKPYFCPQ